MIKNILIIAAIATTIQSAVAQINVPYVSGIQVFSKTDSTSGTGLKVRVTGRIDAMAFYDTNNSNVEAANGLIYFMPKRPTLDPTNGSVVDNPDLLRFSIAASRFGLAADYTYKSGLMMGGFVETDFVNLATSKSVPSLRLRQAYGYLQHKNSTFLFGQTSHLAHMEHIIPPTVTFAAAYPMNVISRPVQFRFAQQFNSIPLSIDIAASMFYGANSILQNQGLTPDISARITYNNKSNFIVSAVGGIKSMKPQGIAVADKSQRVNAMYGGLAAKYIFGKGYTLSAMGVYGGDLSNFGIVGGYAPLLDLKGYTAINAMSLWADFHTPEYSGFNIGVFVGYQENLGTTTDILYSHLTTAEALLGLDNYYRIAPRVYYRIHKLSFGLEYMYTVANWMHDWDKRYQSTFDLPSATGSRVTLLCRFTF